MDHKKISIGLALGMLIFGILNQNGALLRRLPSDRARAGHLLERSREYLTDLDSAKAVCWYLEKNYFNRPVLAKYPYTQMLSLPELGYVSEKLPYVIGVGRFPTISKAIPYHQVAKHLPAGTLGITFPYSEFNGSPPLEVGPGDRVLFEDKNLHGPVQVFIIGGKARAF